MARAATISGDEVLRRRLEDSAFRREWDRDAFAREVALRVITYRADHKLSQAALGRLLGIAQPGVARLESGDHTPSLETLQRLSNVLGIGFTVDVDPRGSLELRETVKSERHTKASQAGSGSPKATTPRVLVTCDLEQDDISATETLSFSFGGKTYTLNLCRRHLDEVKGALETFATVGRPAHGAIRRSRRPTSATRGDSQAEIRDWARAQGYDVGNRGRIPEEVSAAYRSALSQGTRHR